MNLLCWAFGHSPPVYSKRGWYSPGNEYANVELGPIDGLNTQHAYINGKCARCDKKFMLCRIHVPRLPFPQDK